MAQQSATLSIVKLHRGTCYTRLSFPISDYGMPELLGTKLRRRCLPISTRCRRKAKKPTGKEWFAFQSASSLKYENWRTSDWWWCFVTKEEFTLHVLCARCYQTAADDVVFCWQKSREQGSDQVLDSDSGFRRRHKAKHHGVFSKVLHKLRRTDLPCARTANWLWLVIQNGQSVLRIAFALFTGLTVKAVNQLRTRFRQCHGTSRWKIILPVLLLLGNCFSSLQTSKLVYKLLYHMDTDAISGVKLHLLGVVQCKSFVLCLCHDLRCLRTSERERVKRGISRLQMLTNDRGSGEAGQAQRNKSTSFIPRGPISLLRCPSHHHNRPIESRFEHKCNLLQILCYFSQIRSFLSLIYFCASGMKALCVERITSDPNANIWEHSHGSLGFQDHCPTKGPFARKHAEQSAPLINKQCEIWVPFASLLRPQRPVSQLTTQQWTITFLAEG